MPDDLIKKSIRLPADLDEYVNSQKGTTWTDKLCRILEEYRSKGLGSEFFAYMEAHREEGVTRFRLEIEDDNTRAKALYEKLGYQVLDYRQMKKDF